MFLFAAAVILLVRRALRRGARRQRRESSASASSCSCSGWRRWRRRRPSCSSPASTPGGSTPTPASGRSCRRRSTSGRCSSARFPIAFALASGVDRTACPSIGHQREELSAHRRPVGVRRRHPRQPVDVGAGGRAAVRALLVPVHRRRRRPRVDRTDRDAASVTGIIYLVLAAVLLSRAQDLVGRCFATGSGRPTRAMRRPRARR